MDNDNGMVPASAPGSGAVSIVPVAQCMDMSRCGERIVTSLDVATAAGRSALRKHLMGVSVEGKEAHINGRLEMVHVTAHAATSADATTGEESHFVRVVVQLSDGRLIAFGSKGILKSLMILSALERTPPWDPPLSVILRQRTLDSGRNWLELELAEEDGAPPVEPRRKSK